MTLQAATCEELDVPSLVPSTLASDASHAVFSAMKPVWAIQTQVKCALDAGLGSLGYVLRGTNTLTYGDQTGWLENKLIRRQMVSLHYRRDVEDEGLRACEAEKLLLDTLTLTRLATETNNEDAFVRTVGRIDWSQRSARDFAYAVRLALATGAHVTAQNLAITGAEQHPDNDNLQKMSRLLAPARVIRSDLPPDPAVRVDHEWLLANRDEYRGQWVALRSGTLLATAPTVKELKAHVGDFRGLMVTRVM